MKYIKEYHNYILEANSLEGYQNTLQKILNRLNINLYFISNYGIVINSLFVVVEQLLKNSNIKHTKENIVLITLGALCITLKENDKEVSKLKHHLENKELYSTSKKIAELIKSLHKVYIDLLNFLHKKEYVKISFTDMFTNTKIFVPFLKSLTEIIQGYLLKIDNINSYLTGENVGLATNHGKNIISELFTRVKIKVKKLL